MKIAALSITAMLVLTIIGQSQAANKERPINVDDLNKRPVIGKLGLPIGTATEIKAEIIAGRTLRRKAYDSLYLLKVTHVSGKKLNGTPLLKFSTPSIDRVQLANNNFDLYELKNGEKTGRLNSKQIAKLEKGYVGKSVRLVVYETGGFSGIPRNMPKDTEIWWQDHGFHFSTYLVVLTKRK